MPGIIILAAGSSSRLGQPKQNLLFEGKTLLQRAIDTALSTYCSPIIVVLGANSSQITPTLDARNVTLVYNPNWAEGMASSIRLGLKSAMEINPAIEVVVLMVCDQPFLDTAVLNALIAVQVQTGSGVVASHYDNTFGVPVLFNKKYFDELLQLKGQEGARKLLQKYQDTISFVDYPKGSIDIDTEEDFRKIKAQ